MEHSERSAELCGWAVVYDGSAEGVMRLRSGVRTLLAACLCRLTCFSWSTAHRRPFLE
jgi:hypothetical protein